MREMQNRREKDFQAAAAGCAGCAVAYLLLDALFVRLAKHRLNLWLAGSGAGAAAAVYERHVWAASLFASLLALLIPAVGAAFWGHLRPARLGLHAPRRGIVLPALCLYLGFGVIGNLIAALVGEKTGSVQQLVIPQSGGAASLAFLAICAVPAVCEELLFRGAAQGLLRPYGAWLSIVGQAVLFALLHQKWSAVVFALPAGLYFGYLAERSGSLLPGMCLHFVNNSTAFLLLWLSQSGMGALADGIRLIEWILFPILAIGAGVWLRITPRRPFRRLAPGLSPGKLLRCPPWVLTAAGLAVYCVLGF